MDYDSIFKQKKKSKTNVERVQKGKGGKRVTRFKPEAKQHIVMKLRFFCTGIYHNCNFRAVAQQSLFMYTIT